MFEGPVQLSEIVDDARPLERQPSELDQQIDRRRIPGIEFAGLGKAQNEGAERASVTRKNRRGLARLYSVSKMQIPPDRVPPHVVRDIPAGDRLTAEHGGGAGTHMRRPHERPSQRRRIAEAQCRRDPAVEAPVVAVKHQDRGHGRRLNGFRRAA